MLLEDGSRTETIDVMQQLWTGEWPENRAPQIESMTLDKDKANSSVTLKAGKEYKAKVEASDPDGDTLTYRWEIMEESRATQTGGDKEYVPESIPGLIGKAEGGAASVTAPSEPGAYRLFVYVYDGQGSAGHANIPFRVK